MANALTGDFDVVAEISTAAVNRILAAQHQLTGDEQMYVHSLRATIRPDAVGGVRGIAEIQVSPPSISLPEDAGPPVVTAAQPSSAATLAPVSSLPPASGRFSAPAVRGLLGESPFRSGGSRLTIHFQIRARVRPDPGSAPVPEIIHGEVRITVDADQVVSPSESVITVDLSADDVSVTFTPDAGAPLTAQERAAVNQAIAYFVRNAFEPANLVIDLSGGGNAFGVRHWRFKPLPHDNRPALALLINVRPERTPTPAQRDAFDNLFIQGGDDFAVAIGRDFLIPELRRIIQTQMQSALGGLRVTVPVDTSPIDVIPDPTYELAVGQPPQVTLGQNRLSVSIFVTANTSNWPPDLDLELTQDFRLRTVAGSVRLELLGELDVDLTFRGGIRAWIANLFRSRFENEIREAAQTPLLLIVQEAQPLLRRLLAGPEAFTERLRIPPPEFFYNAVDINPDGIAVRGRLVLAPWRSPVVAVDARTLPAGQAGSRLELNALRSWIPGGTIERFRWRLSSGVTVENEIVHRHQFFLRPPTTLGPSCLWCQWCLEIRGTRDGATVSASNCNLIGPPVVAWPEEDTPSGNPLPIGVTDAAGRLVAHVDLSGRGSDSPRPGTHSANVLVHFAGSDLSATGALLRQAQQHFDQEGRELLAIAVVEPNSNSSIGLEDLRDLPDTSLVWAEDFEGGWANAFSKEGAGGAVLIRGSKGVVWRSEGDANGVAARQLARALDRHLGPGNLPAPRRLRLAVREGARAPDFLFNYAADTRVALRTVRGRPVTLCFFKAWSAPSLEELLRLQAYQKREDNNRTLIVAINDGQDGQDAAAFFKEHQLSFGLLPDPGRLIARPYGISVWPTTISIAEDGRVHAIQMGTVPESTTGTDKEGYS